jgi:nucleoside-diphosphate-sugar epimerase
MLRETDPPSPTDAYGRSKLAAEDAVRAANVPFTILRPVLVYGPGAKGNLNRLLDLAQSPWPLPFGLFRQRRSLLARQNLVGAIRFALETPQTLGETYIVADPSPVTLAEIISAMRAGLGRSPQLLPVPPPLIGLVLKMSGRADEWERLGGSLVADPEKLLRAGWRPLAETRDGLCAMTGSNRSA